MLDRLLDPGPFQSLPHEIKDLILQHTDSKTLRRFQSVLRLCQDQARTADQGLGHIKIPLHKLHSWKRGGVLTLEQGYDLELLIRENVNPPELLLKNSLDLELLMDDNAHDPGHSPKQLHSRNSGTDSASENDHNPASFVRITIDFRGLREIEYIDELVAERPRPNAALLYAVGTSANLGNIEVEFKVRINLNV